MSKAQAACDEEWQELHKRSTWDPNTVREWNFVATESKRIGIKAHVAKMLEICVVKSAELDDKDPSKIFKSRAVLDGSWAKDENYDVASMKWAHPLLQCKRNKLLTFSGFSPDARLSKLTLRQHTHNAI